MTEENETKATRWLRQHIILLIILLVVQLTVPGIRMPKGLDIKYKTQQMSGLCWGECHWVPFLPF